MRLCYKLFCGCVPKAAHHRQQPCDVETKNTSRNTYFIAGIRKPMTGIRGPQAGAFDYVNTGHKTSS